MTSQENPFELLVELGNPANRRTRTEVVDRVSRAALTLMDAEAAAVLIPSRRRTERLVLHAGSTLAAALPLLDTGSAVLKRFMDASEPLVLADLSEDPEMVASDGCPGVESGPALFVPIRRHDLDPAYIAVFRRRGRARFTLGDIRTMLLVGAWLGVALENLQFASEERAPETEEQSTVLHRRFVTQALGREIRRASRYGHELSVIRVQVDAPEGADQAPVRAALTRIGELLARQVRSFDVLGRQRDGGFLAVLPQAGRAAATDVAERMRAALEAERGAENAPTVSLGVACFPQDGAGVDDLVAGAERAMERARSGGPNRVGTLARSAA